MRRKQDKKEEKYIYPLQYPTITTNNLMTILTLHFFIFLSRIPDTGDHTLVTDVLDEDDTDLIPDFGPYTVSLQNAFRRCQQLTIGGSWDQG